MSNIDNNLRPKKYIYKDNKESYEVIFYKNNNCILKTLHEGEDI